MSNKELTKFLPSNVSVKNVITKLNATLIEYSDGTSKSYSHFPDITSDINSVTTPASTTNNKTNAPVNITPNYSTTQSKTTTSTSNHTSGGYQSGGFSNSYSVEYGKPTLAFEFSGIEFWGSPKTKLDDIQFQKGDLIINCTGTAWVSKPPLPPKDFIMTKPSWLKVPSVPLTPIKPHNNGELAEQILLDWADMKPPPDATNLEFWETIISQAIENKVKRIFCCCMAGQGRTGTILASLLLATGEVDEPNLAIDYIRENYNKKAIETQGQEQYIFGLMYEEVNLSSSKNPKSKSN